MLCGQHYNFSLVHPGQYKDVTSAIIRLKGVNSPNWLFPTSLQSCGNPFAVSLHCACYRELITLCVHLVIDLSVDSMFLIPSFVLSWTFACTVEDRMPQKQNHEE